MTEFDRRVRKIAPEQWALGTPCREWSVRDLVGHLVYEQLWAPELLAGCTTAQVGDRFDHDGWHLEVSEMDRLRVASLRLVAPEDHDGVEA